MEVLQSRWKGKVDMWPPTQETNHVYIPETQACACMQRMQIVKPCTENLFLMVCFPYPIITIFCRTKRLTMKVVLSCQMLKQAQEKKILHKKLINKVISYTQANEKVKKRKNKFHYWNTPEIFQTRQKR